MNKLLLIILLASSVSAGAQATASFTASATIIQPIGITTTSNMNFANIDAKSGGLVVLTPDNLRISSGSVELEDAAPVSAATFEVTGQQDFSYTVNLPTSEFILSNGNETMIIKDFTSSITKNNRLQGGSGTVRVGATLEVNPNQTPGIYTSLGSMSVTVNYN